jgi:trigger factor
MTEVSRREAYKLPQIKLPSLEGLKVQVAGPRPPTADELIERLHQRLRADSPRRERKPGEVIQLGDEVECDIVTVSGGRVVFGGVKHGALLEMRDFVHLPGFVEELLKIPTFHAGSFELTLPDDYPAPNLAGKTATFYVEIRRVFEVEQPELDDLVALKAAGLGEDIDAAMDAIAAEIDEEQGRELLVLASQAVLDALADRVTEEVPPAAVDEELRQLWQQTEAPVLQGRDFSRELVEQSLNRFLDDPDLRAQAAHRIKVGLVLGALISEHNLAPSPEVVKELLEAAAEGVGVSSQEARNAVASDPVQAQTVAFSGLYQTAVEYLMSRAEVEVLD